MKTTICSNRNEAEERAGAVLQLLLHEKKQKNIPVLLLLSGGSTFSLYAGIKSAVLGTHVTASMLDERFSTDEAVNNFSQLSQTDFYTRAVSAGMTFIDTRVQNGETQKELAACFESALRSWKENHTDGIVIAIMGIGADGHTAGIMPFPEKPRFFQELFETSNQWMASYNAGNKNPYPFRVTVTLPFLRAEVDSAVVFAGGAEKQEIIQRVLAKNGSLIETPARIMREMKDVTLLLY